jgi:hypothetical protein
VKSWLISFVLWACCCAPVTGQRVTVNPGELQKQIQANTLPRDIAGALGLEGCVGRNLESTITYTDLIRNEPFSIVQAYATYGNCGRSLVVFRKTDGKWEHIETIQLQTLAGIQPQIGFFDLLGTGSHQIVVQGQQVDIGSDSNQKNFTIYALIDGKLQIVFDAPLDIRFDTPLSDKLYTFEQHSVFRFVPDPESNGKQRMIYEVQRLTEGKITITRYRNCVWQAELQRFRCYETGPR